MARPGNSPAQQLTRGTWSLSFPAEQLVSCRHSWHTGVIILPSTGLLSCISFPFTLLFYRCSVMIPWTLSFLHHVPLFVDYFFHFSKLEWVTFSLSTTHTHQFKNVSKQYWLSCISNRTSQDAKVFLVQNIWKEYRIWDKKKYNNWLFSYEKLIIQKWKLMWDKGLKCVWECRPYSPLSLYSWHTQ